MPKHVQITLPPNWRDSSAENPDGPPTYLRSSACPGPLQVSWAWYCGGQPPNPTDADLVDLATLITEKIKDAEPIAKTSGACAIGRFGSAVINSNEFGRVQVWYLSNGFDFITVTHIGAIEPEEIAEAELIVASLGIVDGD